MAEEINKTYTSNTLYNDSTGVIAFAEQLKQELINWANYQHVTEELGQNRPDLQSELNDLFLSVYERFLTFLNDADASKEAINTWKEIENFLADYTDDKTLASIVAELNNKIESRLAVPLESTTGSSTTSTMTQKAITETIDASKTFTTGEKVENVGIDNEPTAGSDNLVKSGGVHNELALGAVYDVSAKNPTAGPNNDGKWESLSALLSDANLSTLIPTSVRKGGMSIKFVQSSDNKYVQYRLMAAILSTTVSDWAICSDTILIENPEFIKVYTDKNDKILWAIKADGTVYFGAGVPPQVVDYIQQKIEELSLDEYENIVTFLDGIEEGDKTLQQLLDEKLDAEDLDSSALSTIYEIDNPEYIQVTTDAENKILEGTKTDGTKVVGGDTKVLGKIDIQGATYTLQENPEWSKVLTDAQDRVIAGVRKDGSVYIGELDDYTREMIKSLIDIPETTPIVINIPLLDANFTSPVPVTITGTKGTENAKYEFELPLSEDAFNIRFKFKITENILNQNKNAVIAKLGNANAVYATVTTLSQLQSSTTYNGETKIMNWPSLRGGIGLNGSSVARTTNSIGDKQNIGNFAFYIKYTGESTNVTIENTGQAFVVKVDGVETSLPYSTYPTVAELYEAIKELSDFEVSYNELELRLCSELAIFTECTLVGKYYTGIDGTKNATKEEYYDSAPFLIPYAVSEEWHQVEIVKIGDTIYASCDGTVVSISPTDNTLVLGGNCGCLFKDFSVDTISNNDAEIVNGIIISSVNPHIIIHEGHNIIKTPTCEIVDTSDNMGTTVDRLQLVYSKMISKGYVPVTLDEIADYYAGNKTLPKRCFTSIFDDYRWVNCLDLDNRAVFTRLGILPTLAIITSYSPSTIVHNGSEITIQQASTICRNYRFGLVSHTRNHRDNWNIKPSTYISEFTADVYEGDIKGIDNSIIVYPFGHVYEYLLDILKWLGFRLGVNIIRGGSNIKNRNRYNLIREDISVNSDIDDVLDGII